MSAPSDIATEIELAASIIDGFRSAAAGGEAVDLSGLDTRIQALCAEIPNLPVNDRGMVRSRLVSLIDDLNRLVGTIEDRQKIVANDIRDVAARQKAVSAYGTGRTGPRTDGPPPKKPK